jgi:antirestriction protein ArdC
LARVRFENLRSGRARCRNGVAFLFAETEIFQQVEENTAAYIANWLTRLENDKALVVNTAGKAQKAVDYITDSTVSKN